MPHPIDVTDDIESIKDAFELARHCRAGISEYCMGVCHSLCCRSGVTELANKQEATLLLADKREEYARAGRLLTTSTGGLTIVQDDDYPCPRLSRDAESSYCSIHTIKRPAVCEHYPIFICDRRKIVTPARNCPAVQANMFAEYLDKFENIGFAVVRKYNLHNQWISREMFDDE